MIKLRFFISLLAMAVCADLFAAANATGDFHCASDGVEIYYKDLYGNTVGVVGADDATSIVIPDKVTDSGVEYTVTQICENAFANSGLRSVTIPPSVNTIGANAFYGCSSLTEMIIEDSDNALQLGWERYYHPAYMTWIDDDGHEHRYEVGGDYSYTYAFDGIGALTKVYLGRNLEIDTDWDSPFWYSEITDCYFVRTNDYGNEEECTSLFFGTCPVEDLTVGPKVDAFDRFWFRYCNLSSLTLMNDRYKVTDEVFKDHSIKNLTVSLTELPEGYIADYDALETLTLSQTLTQIAA